MAINVIKICTLDLTNFEQPEIYNNMYSDFKKLLEKNQVSTITFSSQFGLSNFRNIDAQLESALETTASLKNWYTLKRKTRKILCRYAGRKLYEWRFNKPVKKDFWHVNNFLIHRKFIFNLSKLEVTPFVTNFAKLPSLKKRIRNLNRTWTRRLFIESLTTSQKNRFFCSYWEKDNPDLLKSSKKQFLLVYTKNLTSQQLLPCSRTPKNKNNGVGGISTRTDFFSTLNTTTAVNFVENLHSLKIKTNTVFSKYTIFNELKNLSSKKRYTVSTKM